MADSKISALPASTTPLAGTEVLPIVQSSATKQVSIANLTVGRTVSAAAFQGNGTAYTGTSANVALTNPPASNGVWIGRNKSGGFNEANFIYAGGTLDIGKWDGTTYTKQATLDASGNLTLNLGNLVIGTAGKGIDFSATTSGTGTMTSELLADYEEGTWTPSTAYATFVGAASSSGTYTRVGRQVTVNGTLTGATSVTVGASGILTTSLPFTASFDGIGSMAASSNTASGVIRVTGTFIVAVTTIAPVASITFSATYFV